MTTSGRSSDEPPADGTPDVRDVLTSIRHRKWLVILVTLTVAGLAGAYSYTRVPMYTSTAIVLVRPILTNPLETSPLDQMNLETEVKLVSSAAVADVARGLMGSPVDVRRLLKRVSVMAPVDTQILEISYSDPDPPTARQGAQGFADAYLQFKSQQAIDTITQHSTRLRNQFQELDDEIKTLNEEIASLARKIARAAAGTLEARQLLDQRDALVGRRDAVETTRLALESQLVTLSTLSVDPGQIIQPAEQATSPSSPKHQLDLLLGLLVGLMSGIGVAAVRERLPDRIQSGSALGQCLAAPVLGIIPRVSVPRGKAARLVTIQEPRGLAAEAYRTLRTNFLAASGSRPAAVLVTSAQMGEGKTTTVANLGAALAQLGKKVVVISADLRHPRLHTFFGVGNDQGLGQVLTGSIPLSEALLDSSIPQLRILPSGPVTGIAEPVELLQSDRMLDVLSQCSETVDFVLVDGPPILGVADSLVLAELADGVLFVADARNGNRAAVTQSRHQLRQIGGRLIGGILNGLDHPRGARGYGPYDYRRGLLYRLLVSQSDGNGRAVRRSTELSPQDPGRPSS